MRGSRMPGGSTPDTRCPQSSERAGCDSERGQELADLERRQRLDADGAARRDRDRGARDRLDVGRVDDVHEVELAERGPLMEDLHAELLDVLVDLEEALRVGP